MDYLCYLDCTNIIGKNVTGWPYTVLPKHLLGLKIVFGEGNWLRIINNLPTLCYLQLQGHGKNKFVGLDLAELNGMKTLRYLSLRNINPVNMDKTFLQGLTHFSCDFNMDSFLKFLRGGICAGFWTSLNGDLHTLPIKPVENFDLLFRKSIFNGLEPKKAILDLDAEIIALTEIIDAFKIVKSFPQSIDVHLTVRNEDTASMLREEYFYFSFFYLFRPRYSELEYFLTQVDGIHDPDALIVQEYESSEFLDEESQKSQSFIDNSESSESSVDSGNSSPLSSHDETWSVESTNYELDIEEPAMFQSNQDVMAMLPATKQTQENQDVAIAITLHDLQDGTNTNQQQGDTRNTTTPGDDKAKLIETQNEEYEASLAIDKAKVIWLSRLQLVNITCRNYKKFKRSWRQVRPESFSGNEKMNCLKESPNFQLNPPASKSSIEVRYICLPK